MTKKRFLHILSAVLLIVSFVALSFAVDINAIEKDESKTEKQGNGLVLYEYSFNTENIIFFSGKTEDVMRNAMREIEEKFSLIEKTFSLNEADSDISKFNALPAGGSIVVSEMTKGVIQRAKQLYADTNHAFNPCTYLLTDLWQLSSRFSQSIVPTEPYDRALYTLPESKFVTAFMQLLNFDDITLDGNVLTKSVQTVSVDGATYTQKIDLGGIVKGVACEEAERIADKFGIADGYINLGGSSIVFLNNAERADGTFNVGILNPNQISTYYALANVQPNTSMSTSGDYQPGKFFTLNGKNYCHIIDPETGAPVQTGIRTVSILGADPVTADALTTAIMVMGEEDAKAFANSKYIVQQNIAVAFVYEKNWLLGSVLEVVTNAPKDTFKITNNDFTLCGWTEGEKFVYQPLMPNVWFVASLVGIAAIVCVVVIVKKTQKSGDKFEKIKTQKLFYKWDMLVYGTLAVIIVSLFLNFVIFKEKVDLNYIEIVHQNVMIYRYDFKTGKGEIKTENPLYKFEISNVNDTTVVKVTFDSHFNTIEISGKQAKMIEANCSATKECVNNFPSIKNGNETIVCSVSHLKVLGVGALKDAPILNG